MRDIRILRLTETEQLLLASQDEEHEEKSGSGIYDKANFSAPCSR